MRHFFPRTDGRIYPRRWGTPPDIYSDLTLEEIDADLTRRVENMKKLAHGETVTLKWEPQPKITHIHPM